MDYHFNGESRIPLLRSNGPNLAACFSGSSGWQHLFRFRRCCRLVIRKHADIDVARKKLPSGFEGKSIRSVPIFIFFQVWFATHACKTIYRSAELLDCEVPKLAELLQHPDVLSVCGTEPDSIEVPIFLVREDGVIYSTAMTFTYLGGQQRGVASG